MKIRRRGRAVVTDRKQAAETRYRRLFESARDGIVLVDAATARIIDLNPYVEQCFGYSRGELVGRKVWGTEPLNGLPQARTALDRVREHSVVRFSDVSLRGKDGRVLQWR